MNPPLLQFKFTFLPFQLKQPRKAILLLLTLSLGLPCVAEAQIIPDATLPNNTVVNTDNSLHTITGGTTVNNSLFHSFQEFSLPTGGIASFDNLLTIENIFTRVTGGSISNIDGEIITNGTANLFLLNPNGIFLGPNASINVGGSFVATTADSIIFRDNAFYSATDPQAPPLLTINMPLGLQFGATPGDINYQGNGNISDRSNLTGSPNSTIGFLGGNITIVDRPSIRSPVDFPIHIELRAVNNGTLSIVDREGILAVESPADIGRGDINISGAFLDTSGDAGGNAYLEGNNIILQNNTTIFLSTAGENDGGTLTIDASESVQLLGTSNLVSNTGDFSSDFSISRTGDAFDEVATGNGGSINIITQDLLLDDGSFITVGTLGPGNGGTVDIQAQNIQIQGFNVFTGSPGAIDSEVSRGATGDGGLIEIQAENLNLADGSLISTTTVTVGDENSMSTNTTSSSDLGKGGTIRLEVGNLNLADGSLISSGTLGLGDGGLIEIQAGNLNLANGSLISSSTSGFSTTTSDAGDGGTIEIQAGNLNLANGSLISSATLGSGDGGTINLEAGNLNLADGSQISALTLSPGNGGEINLETQNLNLTGAARISSTTVFSSGDGGNITINTNNLFLNQAQITTGSFDSGNGGGITLTVNDTADIAGLITPDFTGSLNTFRGGILASAIGTGDGGSVDITANELTVRDGATISASNFSSSGASPPGTGEAGRISLSANSLLLDNDGIITVATFEGGGGNLDINVNDITARNDSQITASTTGIGLGGTIDITTDSLQIESNSSINTSSVGEVESVGDAGDININFDSLEANQGFIEATSVNSGGGNITLTTTASELILRNNSLISTSVFDSTGGGGNITINADFIWARENSDILANAFFGPGGNIQINTETIFLSANSVIDASSQFGIDGAVDIDAIETESIETPELPETTVDANRIVARTCPVEKDAFTVSGKGGLPEDPNVLLRGSSTWTDLRPLAASTAVNSQINQPELSPQPPQIIEAQGWIVGDRGQIILTAYPTHTTAMEPNPNGEECQ